MTSADDASNLDTYQSEGTLGSTHIGLTITLRDHHQPQAAHYYLASKGEDMALTPSANGDEMVRQRRTAGPFTCILAVAMRKQSAPPASTTPPALRAGGKGGGRSCP